LAGRKQLLRHDLGDSVLRRLRAALNYLPLAEYYAGDLSARLAGRRRHEVNRRRLQAAP
jgi:hypothetical protein